MAIREKYFMEMALDLALKGKGYTSPNPIVGAVVVKNGKVAGKGYHKAAGEAHAEVNAIHDAGQNAHGSTLYVTLEPCNHTGRTAPCTEKILSAGISKVVAAMKDPNPGVSGGGLAYLKSCGIEVKNGLCEKTARKQNEIFIKYVTTKRPFVLIKCAATLDGRIATKTYDSKWVTSAESRKFVHELRHEYDAIMVGINTVNKDNPSLTARLDFKKAKNPVRIILDTKLAISENAKLLNAASDIFIITGNSVSDTKKEKIKKKGARVIESPVKDGFIDLYSLMDWLGTRGITSILIEGGSKVIASAFRAGIVDKINFFYGSRILGGDDGIPICSGSGPALMKDCIPVTDINVRQFGNDVLIEGYLNT